MLIWAWRMTGGPCSAGTVVPGNVLVDPSPVERLGSGAVTGPATDCLEPSLDLDGAALPPPPPQAAATAINAMRTNSFFIFETASWAEVMSYETPARPRRNITRRAPGPRIGNRGCRAPGAG